MKILNRNKYNQNIRNKKKIDYLRQANVMHLNHNLQLNQYQWKSLLKVTQRTEPNRRIYVFLSFLFCKY